MKSKRKLVPTRIFFKRRINVCEKNKMVHEANTASHFWIIILICGGAFLPISGLPLVGLSQEWSFGIGIITMVILHTWMMKAHSFSRDKNRESKNEHSNEN